VAVAGAEVVETKTRVALTQGLRFYPTFQILPFLFSEKIFCVFSNWNWRYIIHMMVLMFMHLVVNLVLLL